MKLLGLDIPSGLEELFAKIFQPAVAGQTNVIQTKKYLAHGRTFKYLNDFSLFVRWQQLYNGFDTIRKMGWTSYWLTLPFGDHSGASGWPGTGFSAFVYVNAPRFKNGDDLLLDAPSAYPELVVNGTFNGNADSWDLYQFEYGDHNVVLLSGSDFPFASNTSHFDIVDGGTYRVEFDVVITSGTLYFYVLDFNTFSFYLNQTLGVGDTGHFSQDFTADHDTFDCAPAFEADGGTLLTITNISIKQIS